MSQRTAKPFNGLLLPSIGEKSGQLTSYGGPWLVDLTHNICLYACLRKETTHGTWLYLICTVD